MRLTAFSPMHLISLSGNLGKNPEPALIEVAFGLCVSLKQCHGHQSWFSEGPPLIERMSIKRKCIRLLSMVQSGYSNNGCLQTWKAELLAAALSTKLDASAVPI